MAQSEYKVLLIGLGNIGLYYDLNRPDKTWTHTRAILNHPRFELVAGIDPAKGSRSDFEAATGIIAYSTLGEFYRIFDGEVDLAVVASPTHYHLQHVKEVVSKGIKLCVVEKPLAPNANELFEYEQFNQLLMVNLIRLYHESLQQKIREISAGQSCDVLVIYSKGLVHNGIHFLTLLIAHFGDVQSSKRITMVKNDCVVFSFKSATCIFRRCVEGLDENAMIMHSSKGSLYYLNGGRQAFTIDTEGCKQDFGENDFTHYQAGLYHTCESVLDSNNNDNKSYQLAKRAQLEMEPFHDL